LATYVISILRFFSQRYAGKKRLILLKNPSPPPFYQREENNFPLFVKGDREGLLTGDGSPSPISHPIVTHGRLKPLSTISAWPEHRGTMIIFEKRPCISYAPGTSLSHLPDHSGPPGGEPSYFKSRR
jgi:hypothetical protein